MLKILPYLIISHTPRFKARSTIIKIVFPSSYETFIKTEFKNLAETNKIHNALKGIELQYEPTHTD